MHVRQHELLASVIQIEILILDISKSQNYQVYYASLIQNDMSYDYIPLP